MRLTMSVINQDGATNELSSGNWTECGYCLPEWFGASVSFVGDDFFCFSCMGLSKDFFAEKKKKEWKKERRRFIRFGDILAFFYSIFSRCILKRTRYLKDPLICFIMLSRQFFIIYTTNFFCAQEIQISQSVIKIYLFAKKINTNLKIHSDFSFCKLFILKQYYFLYNKFQIFQIFLILPSSILFSHLLSLFYSSNTTSILNPRSKRSPIDWRSSIGQKLYSTWAKR